MLVIGIGFLAPKVSAQSDKYSTMAPVDQYLMERNAEILLARSAAPDSISSDATILVLGRQGYETAVQGKNGFGDLSSLRRSEMFIDVDRLILSSLR